MRKLILAMALPVLTALFLAACGAPARQPSGAAAPTRAAATPTTAAEATPTKIAEATPTKASAETKPMTETKTMTTTHVMTETGSAAGSKPMTETTTMTATHATTSTTGATSGAMVMTHEDATLGKILVDAKGMALYVFDKDTAGKSACTGDCLKNWPALTAKDANETITADASVTGKLSVIKRDDGTYQVAVDGMPLYYYAKDTKAGETTGQGVGDVWWVVGLDGKKITTK